MTWELLASVVADGVGVTTGTRLSITLTGVDALDAVEALVVEAYVRGAYPQVMLIDERFDRAALRRAPTDVLSWVPELEAHALEWADSHVAVRPLVPPEPRSDQNHTRLVAQKVAKGRISTLRWERTRWCVVRIPTPPWAQYRGVEHGDLLEQFFDGCLLDWPAQRKRWRAVAERLSEASTIRIVGSDTDLTFDVSGRPWVVFGGEANMPDGEVATAPREAGVDGRITFEDPLVFAGREVQGLALRLEAGRVVELSAEVGGEFAAALVATDEGAGRVGELGIGLNDRIKTLTGDLFFDEKIMGTVHIALGRAYSECGGTNESAIHWDIVKDLRPRSHHQGGSLIVDDVPLIEAGALHLDHLV